MSDAPTPTPAPTQPDRIESVNTWGRVVVSAVMVISFLVCLILVLTRTIPESQITDDMLSMLGTLTSAVVYYWIGSSAGSTSKTAQMAKTPAGSVTTTTGPTQ